MHACFHICKSATAVKVFEWAAWATEYTTRTCLHTQTHTSPPMGKTEWGVLRAWFMMTTTPSVDPLKGQQHYRGSLTSSERVHSLCTDNLELSIGNWSWEARLKSGAAQTRRSSRGIHNRFSELLMGVCDVRQAAGVDQRELRRWAQTEVQFMWENCWS